MRNKNPACKWPQAQCGGKLNNYTVNNSVLPENCTIVNDLWRLELTLVVPQVDTRS